jgi:hypothetical protein
MIEFFGHAPRSFEDFARETVATSALGYVATPSRATKTFPGRSTIRARLPVRWDQKSYRPAGR